MKLFLAEQEAKKWIHNAAVFLAPVFVLYLTTIYGVISQPHHVFAFTDFIPDAFAQGGIILWFLNAALDYLRKIKS